MLIREFVALSIFLIVVLAIYIKEGLLIFKLILHKIRRKQGPSGFFTKPAAAVHILASAGLVCFLYGIFIEPYWIEVNRVELKTGKLSHSAIRVVQISDLHSDTKVANEEKMTRIVNSLNPDVIVFTGDTASAPEALPVFKTAMKNLQAKIGKFYVTGNLDSWLFRNLDPFEGTGFVSADRRVFKLTKDGESFFISGLDFAHNYWWYGTLKKIPPQYYSIFLCHKSDLVEDIKGVNVDLYLAGHTHGGQVRLPFYGAVVTLSKFGKKYEAGEYKVGNTVLYVNRGVGTESKAGLRVRFLTRPEITVFDISPLSRR